MNRDKSHNKALKKVNKILQSRLNPKPKFEILDMIMIILCMIAMMVISSTR